MRGLISIEISCTVHETPRKWCLFHNFKLELTNLPVLDPIPGLSTSLRLSAKYQLLMSLLSIQIPRIQSNTTSILQTSESRQGSTKSLVSHCHCQRLMESLNGFLIKVESDPFSPFSSDYRKPFLLPCYRFPAFNPTLPPSSLNGRPQTPMHSSSIACTTPCSGRS